jgi:XdhC and CoxI family
MTCIPARGEGSAGRALERVKDVVDHVRASTAPGERAAVATVVGVRRSAARPPGANMANNERGQVSGALSGGCVEGSEAWEVGLPYGRLSGAAGRIHEVGA